MERTTGNDLLDRLAEEIGSVKAAHPPRVAVDGPSASGKTTQVSSGR